MLSECPKFTANIFNPSKCSNCFKLMEEHCSAVIPGEAIKKKVLKCGYLFIAPRDWDFSNSVQKTKRWQRRWFVLYDDGELTWSLDEQPETIPQGTLDMSTVVEVANAESLTDNQYSLSLTNSKGSSIFIKGTSNEEMRGWELMTGRYKSNKLSAVNSSGALISNNSNKRRMTIGGPMVAQSLPLSSVCDKKKSSSSSSVGSTSSSNNSSNMSINKSSRYLSDVSLMSPRGDPDGCGEKSVVDHGPLRKGWLLKYGQGQVNNMNMSQEDTCWSKYWFVLRNSKLLYFTNADEEECLGSLNLDLNSRIESIETNRHYGFNVQTWSLAAITNGMRGIWIKSLEASLEAKKINLDDHHHHLNEENTGVVKSHGISGIISNNLAKDTKEDQRTVDSNNSNNSSSTSVVLSPLLKSKKNLKWRKKAVLELKEEFHKFNSMNILGKQQLQVDKVRQVNDKTNSDRLQAECINNSSSSSNNSNGSSNNVNVSTTSINSNSSSNPSYPEDTSLVDEIVELRVTVRQLENEIECLSQEKQILSLRLNDFTEKLYQSEKLNKQLRLKVSRVKGQSLKDKQIEIELLNKIAMLEDEIKTFNFQQQQYEGGRPCAKCSVLQEVIKDREIKLNELENCIGDMEIQFHRKVQVSLQELRDFITRPNECISECHDVRVKYQREVGELKNLCSKGLEALENSHRRMIAELEENHRREIQSLRIEKEAALQEETNATLAALDALRKNNKLELQREMTRFKEEFIRKFQDGQDLKTLSALHREHEEELAEIKNEILMLSDKYSVKCLETAQLEDNIEQLNGLLLEAKRRILEVEGAGFLGVLCFSIDNNNDKSNTDSESNSKSSDCPSQTRKSILRSPSFHNTSQKL